MKPNCPFHAYFILIGLISGCAFNTTTVEYTDLVNAQAEIREQELMDVGIEIFDTHETDADAEEKALLPEIRKSESRFFPNHLKSTLQRSGHWGAVRVIPDNTAAMDVIVKGQIIESDGEMLVLGITASDATGTTWFQKTYEAEAEPLSYYENRKHEKDVFQDLYNTIANDLIEARASLTSSQIQEIRQVSQIKFAANLAPDSFGNYLRKTENGIYQIDHLPADSDPMMERVLSIRERENMLVDTVNEHYDLFYDEMWDSYENWRKAHREEVLALREVEASVRNRYLLGGAAILGAIALEVLVGGNTSTLRNLMALGGVAAIKSGYDKSADTQIHEDAIRELDNSFEAEVAPIIVEIEGRTVKLTGSAEQQFQNWRRILKEIYAAETGFAAIPMENTGPDINDPTGVDLPQQR